MHHPSHLAPMKRRALVGSLACSPRWRQPGHPGEACLGILDMQCLDVYKYINQQHEGAIWQIPGLKKQVASEVEPCHKVRYIRDARISPAFCQYRTVIDMRLFGRRTEE